MKPGIGLIGRKLGMTQVFQPDGRWVPVTVVQGGPCVVTRLKTPEKDSYRAVQVSFGERKTLREFHLAAEEQPKVGDAVNVALFKPGDRVDVTGTSIGKGFQGGMKRWHWKGGPASHGSMSHRRPGSIGSSTDPGRVFKGHHLPGRMGGKRVTTPALVIVQVDVEKNLLLLKGSVPGHDKGIILIRRSRKPPQVAHAPQQASAKKKAGAATAKPAPAAKAAKPAKG